MVLRLIFKLLSHFEFIFVCGIRICSDFIDVHDSVPAFPTSLAEETFFSHCAFLPPLSKINCPLVCGFISELSIMFHWPICLFFCQYHAVLITVALQYCLRSGKVIFPALFFFLRITLAILIFYGSI